MKQRPVRPCCGCHGKARNRRSRRLRSEQRVQVVSGRMARASRSSPPTETEYGITVSCRQGDTEEEIRMLRLKRHVPASIAKAFPPRPAHHLHRFLIQVAHRRRPGPSLAPASLTARVMVTAAAGAIRPPIRNVGAGKNGFETSFREMDEL